MFLFPWFNYGIDILTFEKSLFLEFEISDFSKIQKKQLCTVVHKPNAVISESAGANGKIEQAWYKISPKATPEKLLAALEDA